jgi:hypothetical protein
MQLRSLPTYLLNFLLQFSNAIIYECDIWVTLRHECGILIEFVLLNLQFLDLRLQLVNELINRFFGIIGQPKLAVVRALLPNQKTQLSSLEAILSLGLLGFSLDPNQVHIFLERVQPDLDSHVFRFLHFL